MKRSALAIIAGALIFGSVYGLAASLNMSAGSLGAGNTSVASCQSGTLTVSYTTAYDSVIPAYEVTQLTVDGLQSGCYSKPYRIVLVNASNVSLAEVTGTTPGSGTSFTSASLAASNVPAASVTGVHLTIAG